MTSNFSADPTPRPPETTIAASDRSGRSPFSSTTRSVIRAPFAASDRVTETSSTMALASAALASGATELGRTVMIGVPVVTVDETTVDPPKTCCSATGPASPLVTSVASVITPEPVFRASRAAISLPSALEVISTAAGEADPTNWARASAVGATR